MDLRIQEQKQMKLTKNKGIEYKRVRCRDSQFRFFVFIDFNMYGCTMIEKDRKEDKK